MAPDSNPPLRHLALRPMDILFIEDFRLDTWIGIYPREKAAPQTVEISLHIGMSATPAGSSDDIRDTIDYAVVVERLRQELASRHFNLLEKLAEHTAELILRDFHAQWIRVSVAKLGMFRGIKRVGVVIERSPAPPATAKAAKRDPAAPTHKTGASQE